MLVSGSLNFTQQRSPALIGLNKNISEVSRDGQVRGCFWMSPSFSNRTDFDVAFSGPKNVRVHLATKFPRSLRRLRMRSASRHSKSGVSTLRCRRTSMSKTGWPTLRCACCTTPSPAIPARCPVTFLARSRCGAGTRRQATRKTVLSCRPKWTTCATAWCSSPGRCRPCHCSGHSSAGRARDVT